MKIGLRQFAALALILSWIFAQNVQLQHEYSSEHLSQTESHLCLSHVNDNDDLSLSSVNHSEITLLTESASSIAISCSTFSKTTAYHSRAPPISHS
ncbi:MAG: hypothetical protein KUG78_02665 [Kangiellaceae bacterium]|nr:hypothetical protein [Kangiellaceae bacterium]